MDGPGLIEQLLRPTLHLHSSRSASLPDRSAVPQEETILGQEGTILHYALEDANEQRHPGEDLRGEDSF